MSTVDIDPFFLNEEGLFGRLMVKVEDVPNIVADHLEVLAQHYLDAAKVAAYGSPERTDCKLIAHAFARAILDLRGAAE